MGTIYPFVPPIEIGDQTVVFNHIGKTGGLTLISILDSLFPPEKVCKAHSQKHISLVPDEFLNQYQLIRAHLWSDIRLRLHKKPIFLTMLRNPPDLIRSVYQHVRRTEDHDFYYFASQMSFREFVFTDNADLRIGINNWQTRCITSQFDVDTQPDLALAKQYLREEYAWVGLTERYNDSLELLSYTFGWPSLTQYEKQNVTPNRIEHIEPDVLARIQELNQIDIALYALLGL